MCSFDGYFAFLAQCTHVEYLGIEFLRLHLRRRGHFHYSVSCITYLRPRFNWSGATLPPDNSPASSPRISSHKSHIGNRARRFLSFNLLNPFSCPASSKVFFWKATHQTH